MKSFLIEPRDPLIARDGRPSALGRFESLPFPLPSTIAGAVRTRMASPRGTFAASPEEALRLLELAVYGPLLARLGSARDADANASTEEISLCAPAPRDATISGQPDALVCRRLAPRSLPKGCTVGGIGEFQPVTFAAEQKEPTKDKSPGEVPQFWSWPRFEAWLTDPKDESPFEPAEGEDVVQLPREARTHLALRMGERRAVDGALFGTEGLRFLTGVKNGLNPLRLGLAIRVEEDPEGSKLGWQLQLRNELAPIGGERRLARWRQTAISWPVLPPKVEELILASRAARLVLLTPGLFDAGALPGWNGGPFPGHPGVRATVVAACVPRPSVISGWNLVTGKPKSTRRLVAAGSVYFVELEGNDDDLKAWCRELWLSPVSDHEQDRRDGFGLTAIGVWPRRA